MSHTKEPEPYRGWIYDPRCDCQNCQNHRLKKAGIESPAAFLAAVDELVAVCNDQLSTYRAIRKMIGESGWANDPQDDSWAVNLPAALEKLSQLRSQR